MVTVSEIAVGKFREILESEGKTQCGFRFYTTGGGCCGPSYGIDIVEQPSEDDEVIDKDGVKVFIEKSASEKLNGMEIHFVDDGEKQGFVFTGNQPSCDSGCGSSCG